MKRKLIINADDLGFTKGVNAAVKEAHLNGFLTHASLMANTKYFEEAVNDVVKSCPNLKIGVHVNLTCGNQLAGKDEEKFNDSFMGLLLKSKTKNELLQIENEIEKQILAIRDKGINIAHIDGHEHVHIIPSINKIVRKLAKKYNIPRVREINENFSESHHYNGKTASKVNYIKFLLLRFLSRFNSNSNEVKFYSILNTCEINGENLFSYLENTNDKQLEIMLHPSIVEMDKNEKDLDSRFIEFLTSDFRTQEYNLCFDKNFEKYV